MANASVPGGATVAAPGAPLVPAVEPQPATAIRTAAAQATRTRFTCENVSPPAGSRAGSCSRLDYGVRLGGHQEHSAVDHERGSGRIGRLGRAQERDHGAYLTGVARPAERDRGPVRGRRVLVFLVRHRRRDLAGSLI